GHPAELCYESAGIGEGAQQLLFCDACWPNCHNLLYCNVCSSSHHCFGCIGLKQKSYCIFNKQYTKEEYEKLVPKIITQMMERKEWGEFFPVKTSVFGYNETPAQRHQPLTKEEVLAKSWSWKDEEDQTLDVKKVIDAKQLPDSSTDTPDDILHWAIRCTETDRPFRITKQELGFYREMHLPIPRLHPDERSRLRMLKRNPRKLWDHTCDKCSTSMKSSYDPARSETVYCESCYRHAMY
ncbi:MAG: hypothetical protein O2904_03570, partial [bacterium]|nr:hypothetical protein [bacterium]